MSNEDQTYIGPNPVWGQPGMYAPSPPPPPKKKRTMLVVGITIVVLALCAVGGSLVAMATGTTANKAASYPALAADPSAKPKTKATTYATNKPDEGLDYFEQGTYEIGKVSNPETGTIKPGTYVLITPDHCYWERVSGFGGDFNDIIANDNLEATGDKPTQARVTIKKSDKGFTMTGNCILGQKGGLK